MKRKKRGRDRGRRKYGEFELVSNADLVAASRLESSEPLDLSQMKARVTFSAPQTLFVANSFGAMGSVWVRRTERAVGRSISSD